jgi:hypothetical protein
VVIVVPHGTETAALEATEQLAAAILVPPLSFTPAALGSSAMMQADAFGLTSA